MTSKTERRRKRKDGSHYVASLESRGSKEKIVTPESILNNAAKLDFGQEYSDDVQQFCDRYKKTFQQRKPSNFLHVLAERSAPDAETAKDWPKEGLCSFLKWFLQHYDHFLTIQTESGVDSKDFPLHTAFSKKNYVFVEAVLSHPGLMNLQQVLEQKTTTNQTYIHLAITSKSPVVKLLADKCEQLRISQIWKGSGENNSTPLHVAVEPVHEFCNFLEQYLYPSSDSAERMNVQTILCQVKGVLKSNRESAPAEANHLNNTVSIFHEWKREVLRPGGEDRITAIKPKAVTDLLLKLIWDHQDSDDQMSQVNVVELLISLCDTVLSDKGLVDLESPDEGQAELTPYQTRLVDIGSAWGYLIEFLEGQGITVSEEGRESALRHAIVEDPVADAIRSHCLHNFDRDGIAKCLYEAGEERDIDFDLSGLPNPTISNAFLQSLSKHLKFESILKYVALPKLALDHGEAGDDENGEKSIFSAKKRTVADLRRVFTWLRGNGVKSIITVTVLDYGNPCHSDEAIEEALKGFQVENWDWKKVDLCTDVISASSDKVKTISLYSSGNNAVLMGCMGWASSEGLVQRNKFPQLEKVRLFIQQGQESTKRREDNIKAFEDKIRSTKIWKDGKTESLRVEHRLDDGKVSYAAYFGTSGVASHQEIPWISEIERFATFLSNEKSIHAGEVPIKIAIIDDGVDSSLDIFTGKITTGRSFCPLGGSNDLMNAYYVPSGNHGTMMADLICRICPSCQLYVARVDESTNRSDMSRQITVKSAAEAIEWAVACKVDIISMSWTIEGRTGASQESKDLDGLKVAITKAESEQILMFCAASDQGSNASENCYPGKWDKCIRIGAATALGDKCTWVPNGQIEYLLPGKDIPFKIRAPGGFSTVHESGSSLATALASGLAGLLLCCDRLTRKGTEAPLEASLEGREKMSDAFRKLAGGAYKSDKTFVEAHKWFGTKFWRLVREAAPINGIKRADTNGVNGKASRPPLAEPTEWSDQAGQALKSVMKEISVANRPTDPDRRLRSVGLG